MPEARRAIVEVDVTRISDSCGYGVPLMSFEGLREHHALSTAKKLRTKGVDGLRAVPPRRQRRQPRRAAGAAGELALRDE